MKIILLSIIIITLSALTSPVFAFGKNGHRITGHIAEQYLTATAKEEIDLILGPFTLAEISTYPDEMKSSKEAFWKAANPLHYVTVPEGEKYSKEKHAPEKGDAVTALQRFSKVVRSRQSSKQEKFDALSLIVHIIGDLHQPMHTGNGTDRGGNDFDVFYFNEKSNLHSVWDSGMIDRQKLSYTEFSNWLITKITKKELKKWNQVDPKKWIAESTVLRDQAYPDHKNLKWDYDFKHLPTVKQRLSQGGVRIALYLNHLFAN